MPVATRTAREGGPGAPVKSATPAAVPDRPRSVLQTPRGDCRDASGPVPGYPDGTPVQPPEISAKTLLRHLSLTGSRPFLQPELDIHC